jgi:hypothetical protein
MIRQRGSHVRVRKISALGEHNLTVPDHAILAKGTLNDILTRVSLWNNIPKEKLIEQLEVGNPFETSEKSNSPYMTGSF